MAEARGPAENGALTADVSVWPSREEVTEQLKRFCRNDPMGPSMCEQTQYSMYQMVRSGAAFDNEKIVARCVRDAKGPGGTDWTFALSCLNSGG